MFHVHVPFVCFRGEGNQLSINEYKKIYFDILGCINAVLQTMKDLYTPVFDTTNDIFPSGFNIYLVIQIKSYSIFLH